MQSLLGRNCSCKAAPPPRLHWAINSVKKGGIISIVGVYGPIDTLDPDRQRREQRPHDSAEPSLRETPPPALIEHVQSGVIDAKALISHRIPLEYVSDAYRIFSAKLDNCIKPVLLPPSARS
jgi:threonine dehydrogenase-like Zn-dependent dehydrogenase